MKNFNDLKQYASLAWAVYADATDKVIPKEYNKTEYKSENSVYTSGFQARVYESKNELVLSIRGTEMNNGVTEFWRDLIIADGNLALNSMPSSQVADMINFINSIKNIFDEAKNSDKKITIVGHSLGGTLSQIASKAFPNLFDECYTFNSPSGKDLFDCKVYKDGDKYYMLRLSTPTDDMQGGKKIYLTDTVGEALYNYQNTQMTTSVTDIAAKDDPRIINNLWWKDRFGDKIEVSGDSHSIIDLTQILYFYDMAVSNGASENAVTNYLSGFYNAQNSLLIGSVANIVQGTISKIDEIVRGNSNPNADIIEICNAYETNNVKFRLDLIAPTSSVTSIFSGSNLTTPALYALVNLNPFIVSGVNSNAYAELEKYKAEYSENYVSDKAKMFKALMDTPKVGSYYDDYETGKKISYYTSVTDPDSTDEYNLTDTAYTFGTNKNDIVTASVGKANRIYTLAGDDTITLTSGSNYIEAGSGNDTIDLSGITDKNSTNIIYADLKDSDDKDSGNDIIIGSSGKDTMYGGSGYDSYYAGSGDTIEDDDKGQGVVVFNGVHLTGGTYDKDKACYVGGIYEYHLNGNTLIVTDTAKNESITINNYSKKDKSLGIDLIEADEIDIIISNATVTEGDESEPNKDGKAPYNTTLDIKLNRKLKEDEFIIIQKYNYKKQATELVLFGTLPKDYDTTLFKNLLSNNKTLDFSWYGNKTKEEDKKYCVGGVNIFAKSDNLTIRDIKPGYVTIKDDDKDPNDDKPETYDPLAIDLNNDGIKGTNLDYKINFDLDNNGFKEATSWIDNNDAFIAIDKNNNGTIDNGSELFGNKSISNNVYAYTNPNAKNGFESLKEFDSNNDDIIDEKDKEFTNLLLWQDKNYNGISETDELIKLSDKAEFTNLNLLIA